MRRMGTAFAFILVIFAAGIPYRSETLLLYAFGYQHPDTDTSHLQLIRIESKTNRITVRRPLTFGYGPLLIRDRFLIYCSGLQNVREYDYDSPGYYFINFISGGALNLDRDLDQDCRVTTSALLVDGSDPLLHSRQRGSRQQLLAKIKAQLDVLATGVINAKEGVLNQCST